MKESVREAVASPENQVFISTVSAWEISIKVALKRLVFPIERFDEVALLMGFDVLPIIPAHAVLSGTLPRHHADPFDRMLVAQAMVEKLLLVSVDAEIGQYDVKRFDDA